MFAQVPRDGPRERVLADLDVVENADLAQPLGNWSREQVVAEGEGLKNLQQCDKLRADSLEFVTGKDQTREKLEIGKGVWNSSGEAIARK